MSAESQNSALVEHPTVLVADEPTGNLDEDTRDNIINLLEQLWRDQGPTLILVTYDTSIARRAQRTAVITDGQLTINRAPALGGAHPGPFANAPEPEQSRSGDPGW